MQMSIEPALAYEHAKREGARIVETLIGDLAAKSAAIDQMAQQLQSVTEEKDKLAERLSELEKPKENGKASKETEKILVDAKK